MALAQLSGCGSGAVSADSAPNVPLTLSPGNSVAYSGVPTTLVVAGGGARSPYQFNSSDAQLAPVPAAPQQSTSLVITPNTVGASQVVNIGVRDQAGQTANAVLNIQPNVVAGDITVTGTAAAATGITNCSITGAVCAGQSGLVTVSVSQFGAPAAGRSVRFEAIQGNFRFPTDASQSVFATSITVTSDAQGKAVAILRADAGNFRNAIIRATDVATGAFRTASFFIRQATVAGAEYSIVPEIWNVGGQYKNECLGGTVDFLIFGGTPPYRILPSTQSALVTPTVTPTESPSRFTVNFPAQTCGADGYDILFTVTDAQSLTLTPRISVKPGTEDRPAPPAPTTPSPSISLSSTAVTLPCTGGSGSSAQIIANIVNPSSATTTITAAVTTAVIPSTAITATVPTNSNVVTITRQGVAITQPVPPSMGTNVTVGVVISAGSAGSQTVTVTTPAGC